MSNNKLSWCFPYGRSVSCICDSRQKRIYKCLPSLDPHSPGTLDDIDIAGEALLRGGVDDRDGNGVGGMLSDDEFSGLDGFGIGGAGRRRGVLDERTEIILAATFLVLIILAFISFVIYRCEKNYLRRRLQESFHISPSGGAFSGVSASNGTVPSISVSVQTDPPMMAGLNGNGTIPYLSNGKVAGATNLISNGNYNSVHLPYSTSATLPHNAHLHTTISAISSGTNHHEGNTNANQNGIIPSSDHDGTNATNGRTYWSREMTNAQSFRDVREGIMSITNHSRENTLSREAQHHISRDDGLALRSSCTQDNLRSPSQMGHHNNAILNQRHSLCATISAANGANANDDDDINTDYAESDVMLGGANSQGSSSGANSAGSNNGERAGNPNSSNAIQRF